MKSAQQNATYWELEEEETRGDIKYTCRFDIQIDNEPKFQVARRVIGNKGANMKRIIDECKRRFSKGSFGQEGVKLRLRGKGSGFLEGPEKKESSDPLNLCVSSKDYVKYDHACKEVERLLVKVYNEYRHYDKIKLGKPKDHGRDLSVKLHKTFTGPKGLIDSDGKLVDETNAHLLHPAALKNHNRDF